MKHNIVTPSVGESITEVSILKWHKQNGQAVKSGELLLEIESDKATVELVAESSGVLIILKQAGERLPIGELIAQIDDTGTALATTPESSAKTVIPPSPQSVQQPTSYSQMGPSARKLADEKGIDVSTILGSGKDGRVTKGDILSGTTITTQTSTTRTSEQAPAPSQPKDKPGDRRVPMSMLRSRIAERLVQSQHTAAILTTFNEVDMSAVMELRNKHKDSFKAKNGVALSFMSFFTKASIAALKAIPEVNASIDGRDTVYHDYIDIGIAVGTERGLVVPVLRNTDKMTVFDIEKKLAELAVKAREGKLSIGDMTGGTFTISNGGTYGSLLSTPIINPPQSGILGMHKIQERPVAINQKIEIRPMMYLALSYDHRLVDGKGAVTFLVVLKDHLENPAKLGMEL